MHALQLATLVDEAPEGDEWLHEQKFDGYRILATKKDDVIELLSRRDKAWTKMFPTIANAIAKLPHERLILDGEVAAVLPDGRTSFQALQNALSGSQAQLVYFAFDVLAIDDEDLAKRPLEERKQRLREIITPAIEKKLPLRYSDHVVGDGRAFFSLACQRGLEGIISKRRDQPYVGGRGKGWLKTKCLLRQELVIGGFTEGEGSRNGIGSLLLGHYKNGALIYAGKVGTGFTMKSLDDAIRRLAPLEQSKSPFTPMPSRAHTGPRVHWVKPALVAEVAFSEWTDDGRLRHPSFQGLRLDKPANDVVREEPIVANSKPRRRRA
jgi:bifunctional non-homologous end joining protein LigD